jgi:hypothetical protein
VLAFLVLGFLVLVVGMILVAYGTAVRNRWGINLDVVFCPCCKVALSQLRIPTSLRQVLWGGYTCPGCGTEVDKWGRSVASPNETENGPSAGSLQEGGRSTLFSRLSDAPTSAWVIGATLLSLDLWYDLYHVGGFIIDGMILVGLLIWLLSSHNHS